MGFSMNGAGKGGIAAMTRKTELASTNGKYIQACG